MVTGASRARNVERLRESARQEQPPFVVLCRPENERKVRGLVEEAGIDTPVVTDPKAPGFMSLPSGPYILDQFPGIAEQLAERPARLHERAHEERQEPRAEPPTEAGPPAVRVVFHQPERPRTVRVETGPEGVEVHLDG